MLRRNINTKAGLVNGALGTVLSIDPNAIHVQFDHITDPYRVETVKSRFFLTKNFCIYRRQFPLILAYAVTIHKCQGLSLDTAILDLSEQVFCAGMAYVALSRVRTLDGLYLLRFSPKAIIVSTKCIEEVNRLRAAYRSDLPLLDVPAGSAPRKRMFQGSVHDLPPQKKQPVNRKAPVENCKSWRPMSTCHSHCLSSIVHGSNTTSAYLNVPVANHVQQTSRTLSNTKCSPSLPKSPAHRDESHVVCTGCEQQHFHFYPVDEDWQRAACSQMGLQFIQSNGLSTGSPTMPLTAPNMQKNKRIRGDGNCLFRSFSYLITGTQRQHRAVRQAIVDHMMEIEGDLTALSLDPSYRNVTHYIAVTRMGEDNTWGTSLEIWVCAHLLQTTIYVYSENEHWNRYGPQLDVRVYDVDSVEKALYLNHPPGHFEVVTSI